MQFSSHQARPSISATPDPSAATRSWRSRRSTPTSIRKLHTGGGHIWIAIRSIPPASSLGLGSSTGMASVALPSCCALRLTRCGTGLSASLALACHGTAEELPCKERAQHDLGRSHHQLPHDVLGGAPAQSQHLLDYEGASWINRRSRWD